MTAFISNIAAIFITFPPVFMIVFYYIFKWMYRHKKRAFHLSVEVSSLVFILANMVILNHMFDFSYSWLVLIGLLTLFMIFLVTQWKLVGDVLIKRLTKLYLRSLWLIGVISYIVLVTLSIILNVQGA
ncbi:hypothetical protein HMI01_05050 [Halolactibacillus miurensis]|uniref:DUF3397 domain-containing protein n=1 Tax=Halolactibacillus miurensis TaxID=306541 RepID=A0A1I6R6J0_9BACI|nr:MULTISPECIES: DUF3397 domain-containing protein [Halolactibacillus]GEM03517.1 hypothetical protein HMI01_05050 [Halolactibacillus miurensis]SFS60148.1 Protein of unknown function [Halolactibacillus miurensis]